MRWVKKIVHEKPLVIVLLILLSLPLIYPLIHKGFFVTDDGDLMIIRLTAFHEAITHGQFPARFLPRLYFQYGYPVSNFLYPGYLYIGEVLHLIRFGFINTIKIILGLSFIFGGICSFFWLRKFLKPFSSIIGSLVYLYAPYHYYDVYKRGSVGEVLALTVVPFILWTIDLGYRSFFTLGVSILILSHNTLAVLFLPLIVLYYAVRFNLWKNRTELIRLGVFLGISLLLTAFFWIPALYDLHYTIFSQTKVSDLGNYFSEADPRKFTVLSIYYIVLTVAGAGILYTLRKNIEKSTQYILLIFGGIGVVSLLLNTPLSLLLWKNLPITFVQFPFRLFSLVMVVFALFSGVITDVITHKSRYLFGIFFFVLFSFPLFFFLHPIEYSGRDDMYYSTNEDSTTVKNEYLPTWVKERSFTKPKIFVEGKGVRFVTNKKGIYTFAISGDEARTIRVNMMYYPGWVATAYDKPLAISYANKKGVMDIAVPHNTSHVLLQFTETPVRMLSNILTILGVGIFSLFFIKDIKAIYENLKK
jgi:hypothetical protein